MRILVLIVLLMGRGITLSAQTPRELHPGEAFDSTLARGAVHEYSVLLPAGGSLGATVLQMGVDVVVEVRGANDSLLLSVDSPNGRNGDEPVEIFASQAERYAVRVRPFDEREPAGPYRFTIDAIRDANATTQLLRDRRAARDAASDWLRSRSASIPSAAAFADSRPIPPLDELAGRVRVLGLGEATHGSREFGDMRLAITKRLIERHGYRTVAIEASATRLSAASNIESGWIGRRTQRDLVRWLRAYNAAHPGDSVRVVGLDAQDFAPALQVVRQFIAKAYGTDVEGRWTIIEAELAAADLQSSVFGNSDVEPEIRNSLMEILAVMHMDMPMLVERFGGDASAAIRHVEVMAQFADYNGGAPSTIGHGRDWYMAVNLLRALNAAGPGSKAVLWGHNAHVAKVADRTTGGFLRDALGCDYAGIALTFREGEFVAQIPNDPEYGLAVFSLPASPDESIEAVLSAVGSGPQLATWTCDVADSALPPWLRRPQRLHWVGALFASGTPASDAFRPFTLVRDFDGILYVPRVTADDLFTDRPLVPPARSR